MKKMEAILVALMIIAGLAYGQSAVAADASTDTLISKLVADWGESMNRNILWEADYDIGIQVSTPVRPKTVNEFAQALRALNQLLGSSRPQPVPLVACFFADKIVVRTTSQPACSQPSN